MGKKHPNTPKWRNIPKHKNLSNAKRRVVNNISRAWIEGVLAGGIVHNDTSGLQGGQAGQYQHLTTNEYNMFAINAAVTAGHFAVDAASLLNWKGAFTATGAVIASSTLDVQGAFTSLGIDDNASAELAELTGDATTGYVTLKSVLEASNSTTGALVVSGGLAVAKKAFIGTDLDVGQDLNVVRDLDVGRDLVVTRNLTVNGTTVTLNAETWIVEDKNITLGNVAVPSDITADGGGITLLGDTNKTLLWDNANDNWTSNQALNIATGKDYKINNVSVLNATTLGASVVSSSLTSVGALNSGSITSGFGSIDNGASAISTTGTITGGVVTVDNLTIDGNTLSSTTGDINITPLAGEDVVIDGHFEFDGNLLTALTDNNTVIAAYAGKNITIEDVTFDGGVIGGATLTTPTIGDLQNATHDHSNAAGGGALNATNTDLTTLANVTTVGALAAGSLASGFTAINVANIINIASLDIDGGTDIGAALVGTDLVIIDDGAGGTNRKCAISRINTYVINNSIAQVTGADALSDGANIATDLSNGAVHTVTLGGNRTLDNPTNKVVGETHTWIITQDGTGGRTLAFGTDYDFQGVDFINRTASAVTIIRGVVATSSSIICEVVGHEWKQYSEANSDFTVTGTNNWATNLAVAIPYKTSDGTWRLKFNFTGTMNNVTGSTLTISGVVFEATSGNTNSVTAGAAAAVSVTGNAVVNNTGNISITLSGNSGSQLYVSGDVPLNAKPTWSSID